MFTGAVGPKLCKCEKCSEIKFYGKLVQCPGCQCWWQRLFKVLLLLLLLLTTSCGGTFIKQVRMSTTSACSTQGISKCKPDRNYQHPDISQGFHQLGDEKISAAGVDFDAELDKCNKMTGSCELRAKQKGLRLWRRAGPIWRAGPRQIFFSASNILFHQYSGQTRMRKNLFSRVV